MAWKPIQNKAPDLWKFLDAFNFRYAEYVSLLEHYNMVGKSFKLLLHVTIEIKFKRMIRHPDHELYSPQHALVEETNIEEEIVEKDQHSWMRLHVDLSFQRIAIITLSLSLSNHCYHRITIYVCI